MLLLYIITNRLLDDTGSLLNERTKRFCLSESCIVWISMLMYNVVST